jgi:multisubunit Na+/H+ antiporter MnhC subunit
LLALGLVACAALLLLVLGRIFWRKLQGLWAKAVQGGAILAERRDYALKVLLPSFGAWLTKLGVIAVFLTGYGITVTFHTVMSVVGGNSIANTVSVTPGGVGVNQATNVAALNDVTDAATATAYSLGQQLAITAWNIAFAVVLVIWAFGWAGGKLLVEQSYTDAKVKVSEQQASARRARRSGAHARDRRARRGAGLAPRVDQLDLADDVLLAGDLEPHGVARVDAERMLGRDRRRVAGLIAVHAGLGQRRGALARGHDDAGVDPAVGLQRQRVGGELELGVVGVVDAQGDRAAEVDLRLGGRGDQERGGREQGGREEPEHGESPWTGEGVHRRVQRDLVARVTDLVRHR